LPFATRMLFATHTHWKQTRTLTNHPMFFPLTHLNRLILNSIAYITILGLLVLVPLRDFRNFNRELDHLVQAGQLNMLIEMLRQAEEKYIIGHRQQDLNNNMELQQRINEKRLALSRRIINTHASQALEKMMKASHHYRQTMLRIRDSLRKGTATPTSLRQADMAGARLQELSRRLVREEENHLQTMVSRLRDQIVAFFIVSILLLAAMLLSLWRGIFCPLKKLEKTARSIAKGCFEVIPPEPSKGCSSETTDIFHAFYSIAREMEADQVRLLEAHKLSSLGTIASGTAHQLNNPLNNISTSSQIALNELEEGDLSYIRKLLQTIDEEAQRASRIVSSLLEYSREHNFTISPRSLVEVIDKAVMLARNEVPPGISILSDIDGQITLPMDSQKMTEVFLNLLINAIQAIDPPGEIILSASAQHQRNRVVIRIRDTGRGIDPDALPYIFDPFFTTRSEGKGSGLGLSVAHGIIRRHGGSIRAESRKNMGTLFIITLPLVPGPGAKPYHVTRPQD